MWFCINNDIYIICYSAVLRACIIIYRYLLQLILLPKYLYFCSYKTLMLHILLKASTNHLYIPVICLKLTRTVIYPTVKCEESIDELTVHVWLLYHNPNFKYYTLFVSGTELHTDGRTDDPITRWPRRTFHARGIKFMATAELTTLGLWSHIANNLF